MKNKIILTTLLLGSILATNAFPVQAGNRDAIGTLSISGQGFTGANNANTFIDAVINFAIGSGVVVFLVMGVWASWQWLTAGADPKAVGAARARFTSAFIGLILLACAFAIFNIVKILTLPQ